jgi:hypothetical protein
MKELSKVFSAVKIYDLDNSYDSLAVEKKMILKMTDRGHLKQGDNS